ncbi:MAG: metallophosphoesterase, partial [Clostridia bacterium]|nr:metallophosphoesterase [Clostridia bacterium]
MSLFAIGDTHLSFGTDKPMDIFGGWQDYVGRLEKNWRAVVEKDDIVVIPGDISWGMSLEQALPDFMFLQSLPGTKLIMKGNHDYWWSTMNKLNVLFEKNGIDSVHMIFNNAYEAGGFAVCGTRGWFYDASTGADKKVIAREAGRLKMSIDEGRKTGKEI